MSAGGSTAAGTNAQAVIITGASDGIGKALALAFSRRRFKVGLIARRKELLEKVSAECRTAGSPRAEFAVADVTDYARGRQAIDELASRLGGLDIFVANAGVDFHTQKLEDGAERIRKMFEINVLATIDEIEYVKVKMLSARGGQIVGVASVAAARGLAGAGGYCASKAALFAYLEALAQDMYGHPIDVSIVAPGFIDTAMTKKNPFPMPFLMNVDRAAERFARAILARKALIIAPWPWRPIFWLMRLVPEVLFQWVGAKTYTPRP